MDYTYLLEAASIKALKQYPTNVFEDGPILIILCYHITTDSKYPFLQFLFRKMVQNPILPEKFSLPYLNLTEINKQDIMEHSLSEVKSALKSMNCDTNGLNGDSYKGVIYLEDNFPVALVNVSNIDINGLKMGRNSEYWFLLPSEVINSKSVCNIPIDEDTSEMFIKYAPTISLLHNYETREPYSLPDAVYSGNSLDEVKFSSIFGQKCKQLFTYDLTKYYSFFTEFGSAVLEGGYDVNGKRESNGINRYAIFVDSQTTLVFNDDGVKYIEKDGLHMIITKWYDNFRPLTYHTLNKQLLGEHYDKLKKDVYMIL